MDKKENPVKQKYILNPNDPCPLCGGELERGLRISNPAQKLCLECGEYITLYSI